MERDSIYKGKSMLLGALLVWVYLMIPIIIAFFTEIKSYNLNEQIKIFMIFCLIVVIMLYILYKIYNGSKIAKIVYVVITLSAVIYNLIEFILKAQSYDYIILLKIVYVSFILASPCFIICKSKNINNFFEYKRKIKRDINFEFKLDKMMKSIYQGQNIVISFSYLVMLELSILIINIKPSMIFSYETKNTFIIISFLIMEVLLGIFTYKLYKKKNQITNILGIFLVKFIFSTPMIMISKVGVSASVLGIIETILVISILLMKNKEIELYIKSDI